MLTLNVIHRNDEKYLNGALFGEKFNLPFTEEKYAQLKAKQEEYNNFTSVDELPAWEEEVKALLDEETFDVIETACPDLKKDSRTGSYYVVVENEVSITPVPHKLVTVILESVDKDIDPTPIVKAWIRFLRNPNFTPEKASNFAEYITAEIVDHEEMYRLQEEEGFTEDKARDRATYNDVAITTQGLICARKYARLITEGWEIDPKTNEAVKVSLFPKSPKTVNKITGEVVGDESIMPDFVEELYFKPPIMGDGGDKFTCGDELGHIIQVGKKHTLPEWDMVNTNDTVSCVSGLHVGKVICRLAA